MILAIFPDISVLYLEKNFEHKNAKKSSFEVLSNKDIFSIASKKARIVKITF